MSSNEEKIVGLYSGGGEDMRAEESKSVYMEFHYTKKLLSEFITPDSDVIEIGCATGYYGMHFHDKCLQYTGVDITPDNIAVYNEKIKKYGITNIKTQVGDATNLFNISDSSYDVVLCLEPMYHLPPDEREKVFSECMRIARDGAVIAFAYINRIGVYAGACVNDKWRKIYPNAKTNKYVFELSTDDERPGVFFFTSPEEMEESSAAHSLKVIKNCGLDFFFAASAVDMMDDTQIECYMELADKMSESRSCTGLSNHALLICRK